MYYIVPKRLARFWLLTVSAFFYASWNAAYLALIAVSILITYTCARTMDAVDEKTAHDKNGMRRLILALSLVLNLGILFAFKYFNFFSVTLFTLFGAQDAPALSLLLPVGISFYTFQALGYTIDVYRREIKAEKSLVDYALFISFFPQLVAGPIERADRLIPQLKTRKPFCADTVKRGLLMMAWGYFLKLVIADRAAFCVDAVYGSETATGYAYAVATMLFAVQIYCDFFGYSVIALGAAKVMGIDLMRNFERPYFSRSIAEFWRRWHISLSIWFRDYLYIPLGGNRHGNLRKYRT